LVATTRTGQRFRYGLLDLAFWAGLAGSTLPLVLGRSDFNFVAYIVATALVGLPLLLHLPFEDVSLGDLPTSTYGALFLAYAVVFYASVSLTGLAEGGAQTRGALIYGSGYLVVALLSVVVWPALYQGRILHRLSIGLTSIAGIASVPAIYIAITGDGSPLGLFEARVVHPTSAGIGFHPTSSFFYNSNVLAEVALLGLSSALYLVHSYRNAITGMLALICGAGLFVAGSRAGWGGGVLVLVVYTVLMLPFSRTKKTLAGLGVLGSAGLGVGLVDRLRHVILAQGLNKREELWPAAAHYILERPFGYGLGGDLIQTKMAEAVGYETAVHNSFLSLGFHAGVFPLILYLALLAVGGYRLCFSDGEVGARAYLLSTVLAILFFSTFTDHFLGGVSTVPFVLGLCLGATYYVTER
jgi:hypothetical protein